MGMRMSKWLSQDRFYYALALCLLPPALLINLGMMTFIDDEAIRSLVALEMKLSGNYITPTLMGEYYYNKPPLYNWLLLLFFNLLGRIDEWTARLPTVWFLCGYAATVFLVARRHYGVRIGFLHAMMLITCGRMLFWDSMLALIDICFSWLMYGLFMVVYHEFERRRYGRLFLWAYLLAAAGFLMKGLPALVFLGCTLGVWFWYRGQWRRLFSWPHLVGMGVFALLVGAYYWAYHQYNSLDNVFSTLFQESAKRTGVRFGWWHTVQHLFTFPLEMTYHFLPWSLMGIFVLHRKVWHWIRQDVFAAFQVLVFLANIVVYWLSPEVYPRYLLMLAPLFFGVGLRLYQAHAAQRTLHFRLLEGFYALLLAGILALSLVPLWWVRGQQVAYWPLKTAVLALGAAALLWLYGVQRERRLLAVVLALLLMRVGFNWFVLPDRLADDWGTLVRASTLEAGEKFKHKPMYLYGDTELQLTNAFYLTNARQQIVRRTAGPIDTTAVYIIHPGTYPSLPYTKVGEVKYRHGKGTLDLGVFTRTEIMPLQPAK